MALKYEWDSKKASNNIIKHGISFEEAITIWNDELAAFFHDPFHSITEDRYIMIGYSNKNNLLLVSFTDRNNKIRIISARKATKSERKKHEESKDKY